MGKWEQSLLEDLEKAEKDQTAGRSWAHANKGTDWEKICKLFQDDELGQEK